VISYLWFPSIIIAFLSLGLVLLFGYWRAGYTLAVVVLIMASIAFGWHIHGGLTESQAMDYYYCGEANGYNRGYQEGLSHSFRGTDNVTQFIPFSFNLDGYDLGVTAPRGW